MSTHLDTPHTEGLYTSVDTTKEQRAKKHWWRRGTFVSMGLNLLLTLGLILVSLQRKETPYLYQVERGTGVVVPKGAVPGFTDPLEDTIKKQIREFVIALRAIGTDIDETKRRWKEAQWRLTKGGRALFLQYEQQWQPLQQREPNRVDMGPIVRRTPRTYEVHWQETRFSGGEKREAQPPVHYVGTVTMEFRPPFGPDEREHNPAGIFFDSWDRSKE